MNRIREIRKGKGVTLDKLAEVTGISASFLSRIEAGSRGLSLENALLIRDGLKVDLSEITDEFPDYPASPSQNQPVNPRKDSAKFEPLPYPVGNNRDLPVKGGAKGGSGGAVFVDNGQPLDWVERPGYLVGVNNAYGVYMVGDSMEPRYYAGYILHVNPARPVKRGNNVVVQIQGGEHEDMHYYVKEFVRFSDKGLVLKELCPKERELTFPKASVIAIHRIVGTQESD